MKIMEIKDAITFKSGYPTFGTGHLSEIPDIDPIFRGAPNNRKYNPIYENTNPFFKPMPGGILHSKHNLDIIA